MLYDSYELSMNTFDKPNISNLNNIDILESLNWKDSASNVYEKQTINDNDIMHDNALNTKVDKSNAQLNSDITS